MPTVLDRLRLSILDQRSFDLSKQSCINGVVAQATSGNEDSVGVMS